MKKTILIADDEAGLRKVYETELSDEGYEVVTVEDARAAIRAVGEKHIDLVIMDIRMPQMDGIEAMNRILEDRNDLPVIINSAHAGYQESFLSWPADAYLVKSSDTTELIETVNELLDPAIERTTHHATA